MGFTWFVSVASMFFRNSSLFLHTLQWPKEGIENSLVATQVDPRGSSLKSVAV